MSKRAKGAVWFAAAVLAVAGCRSAPKPVPVPAPPIAPPVPELPQTRPTPVEPDYRTLPKSDPLGKLPPPPNSTGFRALTEEECRRAAVGHTSTANVLERESEVPSQPAGRTRHCKKSDEQAKIDAVDSLYRELRHHAADELRNRSAADALEQFYRLADAEGRGELLRAAVPVIDQLREAIAKARAAGVRVPVDPEEIDRQRATAVGVVTQADLGVELLNIDIKRRIGLPAGGDRLWPSGSFAISETAIDTEAAVKVALENRPDLKFLRALFLGLTPDTLPTLREILRTKATEIAARSGPAQAAAREILPFLGRRGKDCDPNEATELEIRRQQVFELIQTQERAAADETRAAVATLVAQSKQVGLARWRADQANAKIAEAKKQGQFAELPAILEAQRARADVIAAVMAWHQSRVRLVAAQGLLSGGNRETPK